MSKIKVLVGCQVQKCAEEVSYHLDMVAMFEGQPICETCYIEDHPEEDAVDWSDLPSVTMEDLTP